MEDPERLADTERQRQAEEEMERLLQAQEEEEEAADGQAPEAFQDEPLPEDEQGDAPVVIVDEADEDAALLAAVMAQVEGAVVVQQGNNIMDPLSPDGVRYKPHMPRLSYIQMSALVAIGMVYYALRTRQQWYLALVYLSSSKWAYIVLGNALVAFLIWTFSLFTRIFLNGLRLTEAEGLGDFFRWNITETCLALTMFRSELNVQTGIWFLMLVLAKCLHWVADRREGHLRMTEEAVVVHPQTQWPALRWPHFRLLLCLVFLQLLDILAVLQCAQDIMKHGLSVSILFAFEGAILLVSVLSSILLWHLHVIDGLFHYFHETSQPGRAMHRWIHPWKDHKATLVFAVEVQAQAAKFLFYVTFFAIVMAYYGMPINLFREVYMSFQQLKQRLVAFSKYRKLMANMNRFASPTEEELLQDDDQTCIICRDEMTVETAKRLPGCGHLFHKSCLREWLVQQQTCPTCRGDITAMEARQRQQEERDLANAQRQQAQDDEQADIAALAQERSDQALAELNEHGDAGHYNTQQRGAGGETEPRGESTSTPQTRPPQLQPIIRNATTRSGKPAVGRDKRVRIVSPPLQQQESSFEPRYGDVPNHQDAAFPAFYRVVQDQGASIYNNGDAVSFIIRLVPFGVILLGQDLSWRDCDGENRLMVRMPDGWVCENDVERIVAVPLQQ